MLEIGIIGMVVLCLACGLFGLTFREAEPSPELEALRRAAERTPPSLGIFVDLEKLQLALSQLERHVRQERAAVEDFSFRPSSEQLRAHTSSPLMH